MNQEVGTAEVAGILMAIAGLLGAWLFWYSGIERAMWPSLLLFLCGDALYVVGAVRRRRNR